jgi:hypothetical protein
MRTAKGKTMARMILINLDDELLADIELERDDFFRQDGKQYAAMPRTGMIRTLLREALNARAETRALIKEATKAGKEQAKAY